MNYVYKIKTKYKKQIELLAKYGFYPYQAEDDDEIIYATSLTLSQDCSIFKYLKRALEKIYLNATTEEREEFKDYTFKEILTSSQKRDYELVLTDQIIKEFSECQLCFASSGLGEWTLFINAPDRVEYYNVKVLDECASNIIEMLKKDKIIYKKRVIKQK